jgi:hypothetical protein
MKISIVKDLVKVADSLDRKGLYKESDMVDSLIQKIAGLSDEDAIMQEIKDYKYEVSSGKQSIDYDGTSYTVEFDMLGMPKDMVITTDIPLDPRSLAWSGREASKGQYLDLDMIEEDKDAGKVIKVTSIFNNHEEEDLIVEEESDLIKGLIENLNEDKYRILRLVGLAAGKHDFRGDPPRSRLSTAHPYKPGEPSGVASGTGRRGTGPFYRGQSR